MDCPKCGTWNPDDKLQCWRCSEELPLPKQETPKRRRSMNWLWILVGLLALFMLAQTFLAFQHIQ